MSAKPKILVMGGCGFIGRNLVEYLCDNNLASKIRVADKVLPDLAGLTPKQAGLFKGDIVDFKQANLAREAMVNKTFDDGGIKWDYVINLAGETKYSQTDEVYKENILDVSLACANGAAKRGVQKFIEVSTSQVYSADKKASGEDDKCKPWTKLAKAKLQAEEELRKIKGLNLIVVRPAIVYGPGDILGITPRIICAAVYKQLNETMEFLWDKDLKTHTVHVKDVCSGLWHLLQNGKVGEVYNLADSGDTDQGTVGKFLETIFGIKVSYMGFLKSKTFTSVAMKVVAETANEKHLKPWSDLCKAKGITNTPLTPYLDEELLYNNAYAVDGTKITKTGFTYKYPSVTEQSIREVINHFVSLGYFPKGLVS
jgi:nucleoside-diphosphate-sugar epimerase